MRRILTSTAAIVDADATGRASVPDALEDADSAEKAIVGSLLGSGLDVAIEPSCAEALVGRVRALLGGAS